MEQKTAVEWLIQQINQDYPEMTWAYKEECEQAKQMEKEQIMKGWDIGRRDIDYPMNGEQYYNEIYCQGLLDN